MKKKLSLKNILKKIGKTMKLIMLCTLVNGFFTVSPWFDNSNDGEVSWLAKLVTGALIPEK